MDTVGTCFTGEKALRKEKGCYLGGKALAFELAADKINVNCVCPGITMATGVWSSVSAGYVKNLNMPEEEVIKKFTGKIPAGRLAEIKDVVAVTLFLSSEGADYMTGQAINITGGREMH